jgi:hypothetical protein
VCMAWARAQPDVDRRGGIVGVRPGVVGQQGADGGRRPGRGHRRRRCGASRCPCTGIRIVALQGRDDQRTRVRRAGRGRPAAAVARASAIPAVRRCAVMCTPAGSSGRSGPSSASRR